MPAQDKYLESVLRALIKEGWTITDRKCAYLSTPPTPTSISSLDQGILAEEIVLGWQPEYKRELTGFAVA